MVEDIVEADDVLLEIIRCVGTILVNEKKELNTKNDFYVILCKII